MSPLPWLKKAKDQGCNLIVSHHPLIFKGLRSITGASQAERAVILAIRHGIAVYSSHTALDKPVGITTTYFMP
ncbi:Nif3-like dinuclear metal center hexameric protein [Duncaniella freteri]|uniref:Nif3-like dinuclear metal center hexameric protein n=1 Tax=Duncaniella freteri TaxID=2530391 RepID=UPI003F674875